MHREGLRTARVGRGHRLHRVQVHRRDKAADCRRTGDIEKPESQARFVWQFKNDLQKGDIVIVSHGNRAFRAIAEVIGDYEFVEAATFHQARRVKWLGVFEGSRSVTEIYDRDFMMSTLYRIQREG